jgi:ribose 5-phosphate isomerase A
MTDYKMQAAKAASELIKPGQTIGLGAGTTIAHLLALLANEKELAATLTFVSSSFKTANLIKEYGLTLQSAALINHLDIYFDGCDQFDIELNALKSGGGIHTSEKILAAMAKEFILIGDSGKFVVALDTSYPLVIEVLPNALQFVLQRVGQDFPDAKPKIRMSQQKDGAVISDNGNMLVDVYFSKLIALDKLNIHIKMISGVVEHSLFYRMTSKAIIAGGDGIRTIFPQKA